MCSQVDPTSSPPFLCRGLIMKFWCRSRISIIAAVACPENYVADSFMVCQNNLSIFFTQTQNTFNWFPFMLCILKSSMITLYHIIVYCTLILTTRFDVKEICFTFMFTSLVFIFYFFFLYRLLKLSSLLWLLICWILFLQLWSLRVFMLELHWRFLPRRSFQSWNRASVGCTSIVAVW